VNVAPLTGEALHGALPALAGLRIAVFRAFPYLYDGDLDYEQKYLATFAQSRDACVVAAFDGDVIVGCATGSALDTNHAELITPLEAAGVDLATTFYFGESVLLPGYRGRGLGHAFFDLREAHARARGYQSACFCAVIRAEDHPRKPDDHRPLDAFWSARGYAKAPGLIARFAWKDLDEAGESPKPMQFWMRGL
jgi:GNAT superfamily N-acetyltransferase